MKFIALAIVIASIIVSGTAYAISKQTLNTSGTNTNYNYSCGQPGAFSNC